MSKKRIRQWLQHFDDQCYISFSGGKDSTVLADLVRKENESIPLVFSNTGLEYPELVDFVKSFITHKEKYNEEYNNGVKIRHYYKDNTYILRPSKTFKEVIEEYGYPILSKSTARFIRDLQNPTENNTTTRRMRLTGEMANGETTKVGKLSDKWLNKFFKIKDKEKVEVEDKSDFKVGEQCCDIMKKKPFHQLEKATGLKPFVGTLADEGRYRKESYLKNGCNAFDIDKPQSRPISFWTTQDVLKYIKENNLDYAAVYGDIKYDGRSYYLTKEQRTGCIYCGFGCHLENEPNRYQRLAETHPELHSYCMNDLGFKEVLEFIDVPYKPKLSLF